MSTNPPLQESGTVWQVVERWTQPPAESCVIASFENPEHAESFAADCRRHNFGGLSYRVEELR